MKNSSFPNAPNLPGAFANSHTPQLAPGPEINAQNWPTHDDLEHLGLAKLDYTPGGELEHQVHLRVREARRFQHEMPTFLPDEKELDFENDFHVAAQGGQSPPNTPEHASPEPSLSEQIDRDMAEMRERYGEDFGRERDFDQEPDR